MNIIGPGEDKLITGDPRLSIVRLDELTVTARKQKMLTLMLERQRRMAKQSLYYFSKYILEFSQMETTPHLELCNFVQRWGPYQDTLILAPRGTYKSSVTTVSFPLWMLVHNRNLRILLDSAELTNTKNWLKLIKDHIQGNRRFKILFGDWYDSSMTWKDTAIEVKGRDAFKAEHTLTATSIKVAKVSQHYDMAINDDMQNDTNVTSKEMIDGIEDHCHLQIPILDPQKRTGKRGPRMFVGTRWHHDDIYGRILYRNKQARKEGRPVPVKEYIRKAYNDKGRMYFPAVFTKAYLEEVRVTSGMSKYQFSCNYMNDPQPDEDKVFPLRDLGFFWYDINKRYGQRVWHGTVIEMHGLLNTYATLDPSLGETADSDYTAIPVARTDVDNNIFIFDFYRDRVQLDGMLDLMFLVVKTWAPHKFAVETVVFQKYIVWAFKRACRERGKYFPITELQTDNDKSKDMRIRGFQPFHKKGQFYLRVPVGTDLTQPVTDLYYCLEGSQQILAEEMERYPLARTKDGIDAVSYLPSIVYPSGVEPKPEPKDNTYDALMKRLKIGPYAERKKFGRLRG